ncbi:MAG: ThiF family adenylyltransferase [Actinomycetota bacterium]|nr:ThiF family adenylyltransferase [Actinomycetota bacterium]
MGRLVMSESFYEHIWAHLRASNKEGFSFLLCQHEGSDAEPVLVARDVIIVDDRDTDVDGDGFTLTDRVLDKVINRGAASGLSLVEIHKHEFGRPQFSRTDRAGLLPFAKFVLKSLPNRPYAATVWADNSLYGEWFVEKNGRVSSGIIRSACVIGRSLRQVITEEESVLRPSRRADRQLPLVGLDGQRTLENLRFAVVGLGGIGSHVVQTLSYLGAKHYLLIDGDEVEETNLNRLIFATPTDVGLSKVNVARRFVRSIIPHAKVETVEGMIGSKGAAQGALRHADVIIGCVDDDGPRFLLNRVALSTCIPYFDLATGIILNEKGPVVGGRIAVTLPDGPCLICTEELDLDEVRAYFLSDSERGELVGRGYINGSADSAPAVGSLNGVITHTAITELALFLAGVRPPIPRIDLEVVGDEQSPGPHLLPRRGATRKPGCPECAPFKIDRVA